MEFSSSSYSYSVHQLTTQSVGHKDTIAGLIDYWNNGKRNKGNGNKKKYCQSLLKNDSIKISSISVYNSLQEP